MLGLKNKNEKSQRNEHDGNFETRGQIVKTTNAKRQEKVPL
jgi:hypothetical protein